MRVLGLYHAHQDLHRLYDLVNLYKWKNDDGEESFVMLSLSVFKFFHCHSQLEIENKPKFLSSPRGFEGGVLSSFCHLFGGLTSCTFNFTDYVTAGSVFLKLVSSSCSLYCLVLYCPFQWGMHATTGISFCLLHLALGIVLGSFYIA